MEEESKEQEKEARILSPEEATNKLKKLVQKSLSFEHFQTELSGNRYWYLGDPMPEEFRRWTWREFQTFYEDNKR
jgi:hypothetical protein